MDLWIESALGCRCSLGWFIYAGVYLAFALATAAWHAWAFFLVYAVFYALTEPAEKTLVANLVGPERKGLAFGWYNFAIGIAALPSSLIFGVLYEEFGPLVAFGWGVGFGTAGYRDPVLRPIAEAGSLNSDYSQAASMIRIIVSSTSFATGSSSGRPNNPRSCVGFSVETLTVPPSS